MVLTRNFRSRRTTYIPRMLPPCHSRRRYLHCNFYYKDLQNLFINFLAERELLRSKLWADFLQVLHNSDAGCLTKIQNSPDFFYKTFRWCHRSFKSGDAVSEPNILGKRRSLSFFWGTDRYRSLSELRERVQSMWSKTCSKSRYIRSWFQVFGKFFLPTDWTRSSSSDELR